MNKDGLKKIYLIKSAGYEFTEIDLSDNTLLLGESGVGKTTVMRAVLFFYTMDYSDSILNLNSDTKKSFNDWYFREHNSHLIYEYTKGKSRFLFVVSKKGKLNYSFIDISNASVGVKELFIEDTTPISLEKLNEKIQKANLPNYHTTIKEKYINTFHKKDIYLKKIKQEHSVDFSLFEGVKSTQEYAKTLSNIFMASKVNSISIKKSIVSLIENADVKIDLHEIKVNLEEYVIYKEEIEKFEKNIPQIELLRINYEKYYNDRESFKNKANALEAIYSQTSQKKQELILKIQKIREDEDTLEKNHSIELSKLDETIKASNTKVIEQNQELRKLEQKSKEYRSKNIEKLLDEDKKENSYKNELKIHEEKYKALTSKFDTIKEKYQKIQEALQKSADEQIFTLKNENIEIKEKIGQEKVNLLESKETKIKEETQKYRDEKIVLESSLEKSNKAFHTINLELAKIEHFVFNKEEITGYDETITRYAKALLDNQELFNSNSVDIQKVEQNLEEIGKNFRVSSEKLDQETKNQKNRLFNQKKLIEHKLDFDKDNLYGYINKNAVKNSKKLLTYIKDEILFSDKPFIATLDEQSNSLFGLTIKFDEEFENTYQEDTLQKELNNIKESIRALNNDAIRKKKALEDETTKATKEHNRQRTLFYKKKEELSKNKKSYEKNQVLAKLNLQTAKDTGVELKKLKNETLQKSKALVTIEQEELQSKIAIFTKDIEEITQKISNNIIQKLQHYDKELKENKVTLVSTIEFLKSDCKTKIYSSKDELSNVLKNNGVDNALLVNILAKVEALKINLENIQKYKDIVLVYLTEYKDKIADIPSLKQKLESDKKYLTSIKEKKNKEEALFKTEALVFKQKVQTLQSKKEDIENFIKIYNQKIQGQDISKAIKSSLVLDSYVLEDNVNIDLVVLDTILKLFDEIKNMQNTINSSVIKILQNIKSDNIFKIMKPDDNIDDTSYLKSAKELIEYIKNDKLSLLKDASLDKFKSNIFLIKKELSSFEEALSDVNFEVNSLKNSIKKAVNSFGVIDDINMRFEDNNSNILNTLKSLSDFYDTNNDKFLSGLFESIGDKNYSSKLREELRDKIVELVRLLNTSKEFLELEDGFVLAFKVVERGNDLKWRQTLNDIGSNGTSTLVKSIINISMLKMVSKNIVKDNQLVSHCILDEIGTISTEYFRELKAFVNQSGFVFLNGMPTEDDMLMSMYPTIYVGQNFGNYSKMILASKVDI